MLKNKAAQSALENGDITGLAEYAARLEKFLEDIKIDAGVYDGEFVRVYLNVEAEIDRILAEDE
jgi:hypothetical protein